MRLAAILGLVSLVAGCAIEMPWENNDRDDWGTDWSSSYGEEGVAVQNARIDGSVGRFSADVRNAWGTAYLWDYGTSIDVRGRENGVVMAWLDIQNVDLRDLRRGDVLLGGSEDYYDYNGDDAWIYMLGCAGEEEDYWEEDIPAEDVEVVVTGENDEEVTLEFTGTIEGTGQELSGEVTIPLN